MFASLLIGACLAVPSPASWIPFSTDAFDHYAPLALPNNRSIALFWKISGSDIEIGVASNLSAGWLAVGTSDAGGMKGANIVLGYQKNEFTVEERFTPIYGAPSLTKQQTVTKLSGQQANGVTAFTFKRPIAGCDDEHASFFTDRPIWFIYAYGETNQFSVHAPENKGQALIDLSGNYFKNPEVPALDADTFVMPLIAPKVTMPSNESTAYCFTYFDLSKRLNEKHQIIYEDYQIGSNQTHHIVAYMCDQPFANLKEGEVKCNYYRDDFKDSISLVNTCSNRFYSVWAKGGKPKGYDSNMGKPVGPGPFNAQYVLMEIHYANSDVGGPAQTDPGSGFKLTVTKKLRPVDVGMWTVGVPIDAISLPPASTPSVEGECGSKCTSVTGGIPSTGISVISTMLHMHRRGQEIVTRHIRGDQELAPITGSKYFDFNFQSYTFASSKQEKIMPGDRLITSCKFDMLSDKITVPGGHSSEQEMCFNFIEYYPAINQYPACLGGFMKGLNFNACPAGNTTNRFILGPSDQPAFKNYTSDICPVSKKSSALKSGVALLSIASLVLAL